MAITPTAAQLSVLQLNAALFGSAAGTTAMAAALPTFTDGNTYAQSLITSSSAYSILTPEQAYTKAITQMSVGTAITAADISALVTALLEYTGTGKLLPNVGAGLNLVTTFLYNNASTLSNVWTTTAKQLVNRTEVASYYTLDQGSTAASTTVLATVTSDPASVTAGKDAITAQTFNLTTGVDNIQGGTANDIINGVINGGSTTFTALDTINGGAGTDLLNLQAITDFAVPGGATVSNIEKVTISAAAKVGTFTADGTGNLDFSTLFSGVQELNIAGGATEVDFKAPTSAAVTVTGATGGVEVVGGTSQTVTLTAQGGDLQLSKGTGAITVTSSKQGANAMVIDDGTSVSVTSTATNQNGTTGAITIGGTTKPTGAVTVVSNLTATAAAADTTTGGIITVNGGSTVSVTQTATQAAMTTASTNSTLVQSKVVVNGGAATTEVTTVQAAKVAAADTVLAVTGTTEVNTLTFKALAAGETQIINGLTFTAGAAGTTAAETAFAFANLDNGAKQGYSTKGTYSGTFSAAGWTSGAVANTADVVFTATSAGTRANLADTGTGADPTVVVTTDGVAAVPAAGKGGIDQGVVEITDSKYSTGVNTITKATVNGFSGTSFVKSDALSNLTLANSTAGSTFEVYNNTATTLNLTADTLAAATVTIDAGAAKYTNLNITTTGGNSGATALTAAAVTALTVDGTKTISLAGSTLSALQTVTVKGSAGLTIDASGATVKSVDTTGTSGANTVTLDATKATFAGGSGVDTVTLSAAAPSKSVNLGAGDDKLSLANATTSATGVLSGGDGTDTLHFLTAANAATASLTGTFETFIDSFEKLSLAAASNATINLANMDDISYVISAGNTGTAEVQNIAVTGPATGAVTFLGSVVATSANLDTAADTITKIVADKAVIIAAWNAANPTRAIADIADGAGDSLDITFAATEGNVAAIAAASSNGISFALATETTAGGGLTLTNMANGGTLELTAAGDNATVTMADATGSADSFNLVTKVAGDITFGVVSVAGVESIAITATDTTASTINTATIDLTATSATALTIGGNAHVTLTNSANTALKTINASSLTGNLTVTAAGTTAVTITGGSGNDVLKASTGNVADVLIGGAGADSLYANAGLSTLTGGTGFDSFYINTASTNVNSYSTITDATKGDYIVFNATAGTEAFKSAAVTLGDTAVFQDYANAAVNSLALGEIGWFQFGGNTYIVQDTDFASGGNSTTFVNGEDVIVKLTGLVDLSLASYDTVEYAIRLG